MSKTSRFRPGVDPVSTCTIERVTDASRWPPVEQLMRAYIPWVVERLSTDHASVLVDVADRAEALHAAFVAEAGLLLTGRGRLLLAHWQGRPVGLVALKPLGTFDAEVKRLFVIPQARGKGIGRALMVRLLADARVEGHRRICLETLSFMRQAHVLYAELGFTEAPGAPGPQAAMAGVSGLSRTLELVLPVTPA